MPDRTNGAARQPRKWIVAPVLAVAVLAGCASSPGVPSVVVAGDAVVAAARPQLDDVLIPPYAPRFLVRSGGGIAEVSAVLRHSIQSEGTPAVAITALGTSDALHPGSDPGTAAAPLAPLVSATADIACVVLTTVDVQADARRGGTVAARVNHQVKALAVADPQKYKVVDWNEFLSTLPAPSVPTYLRAGGLLETPAGARWLATADLAAVRACGTPHQPTVIGPNPG
jgi:hypothetical protein